jgi:predicted  nucleic acid-binding Zn-ribbon protein
MSIIMHQLRALQASVKSLKEENDLIQKEIDLLAEELEPIYHALASEHRELVAQNLDLRLTKKEMEAFIAEAYKCPQCQSAGAGDPGLDGLCWDCFSNWLCRNNQ